MVKRNEVGRPFSTLPASQVKVNIADYDGYIRFGEGLYEFVTKWQPLGGRQIRAYNDPAGIAGVAVRRSADRWQVLSLRELEELNYKSRTREAKSDQLVVYVNERGYYLIILIRELESPNQDEEYVTFSYYIVDPQGAPVPGPAPAPASDDEAYLETENEEALADSEGNKLLVNQADGAMFPTEPVASAGADGGVGCENVEVEAIGISAQTFSPEVRVSGGVQPFELYPDYAALQQGVRRAKADFQRIIDAGAAIDYALDHGGPGHNNPPPPIVIDEEAQADALAALDVIAGERPSPSDTAGKNRLAAAAKILWNAARSLRDWLAPKLEKSFETWLNEVAKSIGSPHRLALAWALICGQFSAIADTVMRLIGL